MREAKLRGLGVAIAVEMFNSIVLTSPELRYHLTSLVDGRMVAFVDRAECFDDIVHTLTRTRTLTRTQRQRRTGHTTNLEAADLARCGMQHRQTPRLLSDKGGVAQALDVLPRDD